MGDTTILDWHPIRYEDIPDRPQFEELTLTFLTQGVTNSDRMRDTIRRQRKLIMVEATGDWNNSPSDKFVNEHAHVLRSLVERKTIEMVSPKEYRLI